MKNSCIIISIYVLFLFLLNGLQAQTTETQDIPFAQKRLVYQIPEMKSVIKINI